MKPNVLLTIADLQQKWLDGLMISEEAVFRNADTYQEIKKLLNIINSETVDVGDYYRIASELGDMLHTLANDKREVIFRYFAERIDPRKNADVRSFRFECIDLSKQLSDLEQWRRNRRQLRIIRSTSQSSGRPLRRTI